jgi:hypothetical protein
LHSSGVVTIGIAKSSIMDKVHIPLYRRRYAHRNQGAPAILLGRRNKPLITEM